MADHPQDENSAAQSGGRASPPSRTPTSPRACRAPSRRPRTYPRKAGKRDRSAAGLTSIWETVHRGARDMGVKRSLKTLLSLNQKDGFDCPSCAWPDPDGDRKTAEFCENGAKAVAGEATRDARHAGVLRAALDRRAAASRATSGSDQQGRITHPMVRRRGADHYEPISWDDAFALIARRAERARVARTRRRSTPRAAPATRRRSSTACSRASSAPTTCPTARTCATSRAASG